MSTNGFALKQNVADFIRQKRGVGIPGDGNVWSRPYELWHRRDVPKAGIASLVFFNEVRGDGITNLDQANTLPANYAFLAKGLRFHFLPGFDRSGRRLGIAAPTTAERLISGLNTFGQSTSITVDHLAPLWKWAEKIREFLGQGTVELKIGERPILNAYGLDNFPAGRGIVGNAMLSNSITNTVASSQAVGLSSISNGAPIITNRHSFERPYPIFAGQQFAVETRWNQVVDWTEADIGPLSGVGNAVTAGVLLCEMEGELVSPVAT